MANEHSFEDLLVWQQAMELVDSVYEVTDSFPKSEEYALKGQMRRAAVSIPSNIAEGTGRGTQRDFLHFLRIARGSTRELQTQVMIAQRVKYLSDESYDELQRRIISTGKLLTQLIKSIVTKLES
jgi:four helix bundle protein